jgi:hypothetical protein
MWSGRSTQARQTLVRIGAMAPALFVCALIFLPLRAQLAQMNPLNKPNTSQGAVCPLSDSQTQKSMDAFAKIVPTLTQEPRCVNCHGGVDPFADPTIHAGGTQELDSDCNDCHGDMPPRRDGTPSKWRMANRDHFFKGKDAKALCKQMRDVFKESADFIGHLIDDNGNSKFTEVAFFGTRGLTDRGKTLADNPNPQPPKQITHGGLINFGLDWIKAMGGEFKGDVECGCEPVHYAVRVTYDQDITIPMGHFTKQMGPVDIPITFHDDGSFEGEKTVFFTGKGVEYVCTGESVSAMTLRVSGETVEQFQNNHMHLKMDNASPMKGSAAAQCPYISRNGAISGGQYGSLEKDLQGRVGESLLFTPSVMVPGVKTIVRAEIVKAGAP